MHYCQLFLISFNPSFCALWVTFKVFSLHLKLPKLLVQGLAEGDDTVVGICKVVTPGVIMFVVL